MLMLGKDAGQPGPGPHTSLPDQNVLMSLAFRMLGSTHDAEDVVQETYTRWYAMSASERADIRSPSAWLVRVAGRICLDHISSARVRRERYTGEWLPEPLPDSAVWSSVRPSDQQQDPADRVALDDSVSMGVLVLLESLTPAQRVAFILHDVFKLPFAEIGTIVGRSTESCRALAVAARRRVNAVRQSEAPLQEYMQVVSAFKRACRTGELDDLIELLDPQVTARADGGGHVRAAPNPIHGADRAARYLLGICRRDPRVAMALQSVENAGGRPSLVARIDGVIVVVISLYITQGRITDVWLTMNPEKLRTWS